MNGMTLTREAREALSRQEAARREDEELARRAHHVSHYCEVCREAHDPETLYYGKCIECRRLDGELPERRRKAQPSKLSQLASAVYESRKANSGKPDPELWAEYLAEQRRVRENRPQMN